MKIIVLDASGLAGREVVLATLRRGHKVIAVGAEQPEIKGTAQSIRADFTAPAALERLLLDEFPDAIVNTAALNTPEAFAQNPTLATALNVALPHTLARLANHLSARLVHLSTNQVFDGLAPHPPYANTATPTPLHLCGRTRLDGEKTILQTAKNFATVLRVPPLLGNSPENQPAAASATTATWHENLLTAWAANTPAPDALADSEIQPFLSASNLADVIVELCERPQLTGIYHWAGTEALSAADAALRLANHFKLTPFLAGKQLLPALPAENADGSGDSPAPKCDYRLDLHPLRGKLKTLPQNFDAILAELTVPRSLRPWLAKVTGKTTPLPRLVKGVDF